MAKRDFYEVLGVSRSATPDEIKRAYRTLARKHHPDVNKEPNAAKAFAEIQEAYDTLSDESKRRLYDQFGHAGLGGAEPNGPARGRRQAHYDWSNVAGAPGPGGGFDPDEFGSVFDAIFGQAGAAPRGRARSRAGQAPPEEHTLRHDITIDFATVARGGTRQVKLETDGQVKAVDVKIPKGVADGAQLRVRGVVGRARHPGDLILTIKTQAHPLFRRGEFTETGQGLDLYLDLPITIAEATLGGTVSVPTLEGPVDLAIPPGTASGRKLRLRGQGLGDEAGKQGDLYAVVKVVPPSGVPLGEAERTFLEELSRRGGNPRTGPGWQGKI